MPQVKVITEITCPGCFGMLAPEGSGPTVCPRCNWRGEVYLFTPVIIDANPADMALPDDATCIHHPRKKATAVCAGTGDYVCSLCAVDLNGQTYSAEYLNTTGKEKVGKAFDRFLPRPDSRIVLYLLSVFVPGVNYLTIPFAFLWIPHGYFLYTAAIKERQQNELFRRVMGRARVIALPIWLGVMGLGWVVGVISIAYLFWGRSR